MPSRSNECASFCLDSDLRALRSSRTCKPCALLLSKCGEARSLVRHAAAESKTRAQKSIAAASATSSVDTVNPPIYALRSARKAPNSEAQSQIERRDWCPTGFGTAKIDPRTPRNSQDCSTSSFLDRHCSRSSRSRVHVATGQDERSNRLFRPRQNNQIRI